MKYYVIGDIHGRLDLLEKSVRKILDIEPKEDFRIITLGDYIDRGSNSRRVIEYLMDQQDGSQLGSKLICLQGNHESIAVQSISCNLNPSWWMGNGGDTTMKSYGQRFMGGHYYDGADVFYNLVPDEHVKWMNSLPLYYETDKHVFVHAGIPSEAPLAEQQFDTRADGAIKFQWMLYGPSDHGGWRGKHVVHGHHQFADGPHVWHPGSSGGGRTNLDTWAYKTGRIVIGVFDDTQLTALEFIEVTDVEETQKVLVTSLPTGQSDEEL